MEFERKSELLKVRIEPTLKRRFMEHCQKEDEVPSEVVRCLICDLLGE